MCGIAGILNSHSSLRITKDTLLTMANILSHRGPDEEGYHIDRNVGFAHRRLSIIDPAGGHQPMGNEDGTVWLVFNGAIYNYLELRQQLIMKGHKFKSYSDTEVIVHAYEEYGDKCVEHFNGMFAFAIWDKKDERLFAARDRFGEKPFYYYHDEERFMFASEIKAILGILKKPELNYDGLKDYITFQYCLGEKTLFKDIKKLLPGHTLSLNLKDFTASTREYWDLEYNIDSYHTEDYFVDRLKSLIEDSIRIRLRSDVPLGAHLSGGMDSSTVTCIASSLLGDVRMNTFSGGFLEGREFNESEYARMVSVSAKTEHHEIFPSSKDFIDILPRLIYFMDEPTAGPGLFPQYYVSKLAREHVKVVLGGQGGDEIFIGYARYLLAYLEECIKGAIDETASDRYAVTLDSIIPNMPILKEYKSMLQYFWKEEIFESSERRYFRLIDRSEGIKEIFDMGLFDSEYSTFQEFQKFFNKKGLTSLINKITYYDIKNSLPSLLHVEDRTSMAVSLESRVPLLDHRIVELIASVPPVIKFKGGQTKYLFKQAVRHIVPEQILNRKDKMGFPVPLSQWYKNDLRGFVFDTVLSDKAINRGIYNSKALKSAIEKEGKFSRVVWGVLCLELWFKQFIDEGTEI